MKRKKPITTVTEWKELPESFFWTIYHLQLKRMGKNITQAELSFLLGKPKNYVEDVEMLKGDYTITDLARLLMVYGDEKSNIFPNVSRALDNKKLTISITFIIEHDRLYYFAYSKNPQSGEKDLLFKLIEFHQKTLTKKERKLKENVKGYVNLLLEQGVFKEGLEPIYIYRECCKTLQETVSPSFISQVLDNLIAANKLIEKTGDEFQVYYYQQIND